MNWISVKDKLPDLNIEVLVFDPMDIFQSDGRNVGCCGVGIDYYGYHFTDDNGNRYNSFQSDTITHWAEIETPKNN